MYFVLIKDNFIPLKIIDEQNSLRIPKNACPQMFQTTGGFFEVQTTPLIADLTPDWSNGSRLNPLLHVV